MGRGDDELSFDEAAMQAAEAETRRLLARYGEPQTAPPPADLAERVMAAMPAAAQGSHHPTRLRRIYELAMAAGLVLCLGLGLWGVLVDSSGPASMLGDLSGGLSQLLLMLTLAAKPLVNLLLTAGAIGALVILLAAGAGSLWWRLVRGETATALGVGV